MKVILGSSGSGKTKRLLELSASNGVPVLCESQERVERLLAKAQGYGYQIPLPIALENFDANSVKEVYIDEINMLFEKALNTKIGAITVNSDGYNEVEKIG